jgi:hypothetical protein
MSITPAWLPSSTEKSSEISAKCPRVTSDPVVLHRRRGCIVMLTTEPGSEGEHRLRQALKTVSAALVPPGHLRRADRPVPDEWWYTI